MDSLILRSATRLLLPLLLMFAFVLLLRGHNEPGGGFVGGLVAAAGYALYALAYNVRKARKVLRVNTFQLITWGLALALASAALPLLLGQPFFTILWHDQTLPVIGKVSTAMTFDTGVFLVVVGVTLSIVFAMAEEKES